jgi:hypothetical protein
MDASLAPTDFLAGGVPASATDQYAVDDVVEGRFKLNAFLGAGGMGEVFAATDVVLGRLVSLKFLNSALAARPEARGLLEREARAVCLLTHPNICTLHDLRWDGGKPFLVMEYLAGETLAERLRRGPLTVEDTLALAIAIVDGLAHAHGHAVIHRDLKPANVMLTPFGPKIFDFGIAKRLESLPPLNSVPLTSMGSFIGSASYTSPEQAEGNPIDARADIFSLGCVLYEMTTGCKAFEGTSALSTLAAVLRSEPRPMRDIVPEIPSDFATVVMKCLEKEPANRFQTAADLQEALDTLVPAGAAGRMLFPRRLLRGGRALARMKRVRWVLAGLMLVIGALSAALPFLGNERRTGVSGSDAVTSTSTAVPRKDDGPGIGRATEAAPRSTETVPPPDVRKTPEGVSPDAPRPARPHPQPGPGEAETDPVVPTLTVSVREHDPQVVDPAAPVAAPAAAPGPSQAIGGDAQPEPAADVSAKPLRVTEPPTTEPDKPSTETVDRRWNSSEDTAEILQLLPRLGAAFTERSIPAVEGVWPTLTEAEKKRLRESFAGSRRVTYDFVQVGVPQFGPLAVGSNRPDTATLAVRRIMKMIPHSGSPPAAIDQRVTLYFQRQNSIWIVRDMKQ